MITVDLSDLLAPVVGNNVYCEPDAPFPGQIESHQVTAMGDHVYAALSFYWNFPGITQRFLQRFDISDPLNPVADVCLPVGRALAGTIATNPGGYGPSGCGGFGLISHSQRDMFGWGEYRIEIYDQHDPVAPTVVYEDQWNQSEYDEYHTHIPLQHERWAILKRSWFNFDDWDLLSSETSYLAVDITGNSHSLSSSWNGWATLEEDKLWIVGGNPYVPSHLKVFGLSGTTPFLYVQLEIEHAGRPVIVGDRLLIIGGGSIDIYHASNPNAPEVIGTFDPGLVFRPNSSPPVVDDRIVYAPTADGIAVLEVVDDMQEQILMRGTVDLGGEPYVMVRQGGIIAAGRFHAWYLIAATDPDQPDLLATVPGYDIDGLVLSDDHLYVGTSSSVYLYDVSDPTMPTWVGQAEAAGSPGGSMCRFADLLLDGSRVFPSDCSDVVSIDDGESGESSGDVISPTASLHQPTPNPFNPSTTITFDLARPGNATVTIHDLRGRSLATLADAPFTAGRHSLIWRGTDRVGHVLPSGTYLVRLVTESAVRTTKAVLIR